MPNGKIMIIYLTVGLITKILLYKNKLLPPYGHNKNEVKVDLDLATYATKSDLEAQQVSILITIC